MNQKTQSKADRCDIENYKWRLAFVCDRCGTLMSPYVYGLHPEVIEFKDLKIPCAKCGQEVHKKKNDVLYLGNALSSIWFEESRHHHQYLVDEVEYVLERAIEERDIPTHRLSGRVKTIESFMKKVTRKQFSDPFTEIDDLAGVRVVHHFPDDRKSIEDIITNKFNVIHQESKSDETKGQSSGYSASHFVVQLTKEVSGDRFELLGTLRCEIQVRTILEDAWAEMSHFLTYKRAQTPREIGRAMNALSEQLKACDKQFENIHTSLPSSKKDPGLPGPDTTVVFQPTVWEDERSLPRPSSKIPS